MRKTTLLLALSAAIAWTGAQAQTESDESEPHLYLGLGASSLALDNDRIPGVPTSSPGHSSKMGKLFLGYQFNDLWAADLSLGTEFDNVDTDAFALNGYRFFGSGSWRPYVSAGVSTFSIDDAPDDDSQQVQGGFGVSGDLSRNLELRVGYQHHFTIDDESFQDKEIGATLAWHFREPEPVVVSQAEPEPEPAAVPEEEEVVDTYRMRVLFDFDKSVIKSAYEPQFEEIAQVLRENPEISAVVEGHTDWIGTEKYNQGLSERRANAVKQKFVDEYGIDPTRIETKGFGESQPVADNETPEGRQENRRAITVTLRPGNTSQ